MSYIEQFLKLRQDAISDIDKHLSSVIIKTANDNNIKVNALNKTYDVLFMEDVKNLSATQLLKLADKLNDL